MTIISEGTRIQELCHKPAFGRVVMKTLEKIFRYLDLLIPTKFRIVDVKLDFEGLLTFLDFDTGENS